MFYSRIHMNGSGFTNQIMSFILSIIFAVNNKHPIVVVDNFSNDNVKSSFTPISQIINLNKLNDFLLQKYNIIVVDKYCVDNWRLLSVHYGSDACKFDITKEIKDSCLFENRLFINKYMYFNRIKGDPIYGKEKNIYLKYEITDTLTKKAFTVEEVYPEELDRHVVIDIQNAEYQFDFVNCEFMYTRTNFFNIFEDILLKIRYTNEFENLAMKTITNMGIQNKVNVIHLRVENDAIKHWSSMNNMNCVDFQNAIEAKYIALIQKYMNKNDEIIILSSSSVNGVIDFLIQNGYKIKISEKYFEYREKNAIVDLLVSRVCNNIFMGSIHNETKNGSTFSFYISKIVDKTVKKIGIDIDNIKNEECVFY